MQRSRWILFSIAGAAVAAFAASDAADVQAAPRPKVTICHFGDEGPILISVNGNAVTQHMQRHGDILPLEAFVDGDGDGFGTGDAVVACEIAEGFAAVGDDCNDANAEINPGATDAPGNGVDEDCSGADAAVTPG